jgi:preprotein translocase subunit SecF
MFVIKYKNFFLTLSVALVTLALGAVIVFGLRLGIDFTGGSQLQVSYTTSRPNIAEIETALGTVGLGEASVQPVGERGVIVKTPTISENEKNAVIAALSSTQVVTQESFTTIGPSVGAELKRKAIVSIVVVLIAIILFVAYAFRRVSQPVSSWRYGLAVVIALAHDIIIPLGAFAVIGHVSGAQVDTLFVVALLTTLALSISDTIVVFDRIREHLGTDQASGKPFTQIVGESLRETFARSINTSLMVLVVIVTLAIVGPKSTQLFATVLAIGVFFGTYSSIFLASPLLVLFERSQADSKK